MPIEDVTDLDWYIDHVVVPSGPERRPVGPIRAWRAEWQAMARRMAAAAAGSHAPVAAAQRLALTQGFVLTAAQLRRCGVTDATRRRLVRRGEWRSTGYGCTTLLPNDPPETSPHRARRRTHALRSAAAAAKRREHSIAGASAAVLHGMPVLAVPDRPQLFGGAGATFGRLPGAHVRRAQLLHGEVETWFGIPVVSAARSIVDIARTHPPGGLVAADAALHERILEPAELAEAVQRSAGLPGMRRARDVLSLPTSLIESPLESLTHLALRDSGLPLPELQCWLTAADGKRYRVDFLWPEFRLILEADGRGKNTEAERWREKRRDLALERAGYRVVRVTWQDVLHDWPAVQHTLGQFLQ